MTRTAKAEVYSAFAAFKYELVQSLGWTEAEADTLGIDYAPIYGGYTIERDGQYPTGGFMSAGRCPAAEFVGRLQFATAMIRYKREGMKGGW